MSGYRARRRGGGPVLLLLAAVVLLAVGLLLQSCGKAKQESAAPTEAPETAAPTPEPTPTETPTPWNLVLVNREHPVPEDWTVTPVEVSGGKTVDKRIYEPLMEMFEAAREVNQGFLPNVESGYRSKEKQQELYDQKLAEFSAQGYSLAEARKLTEGWVSVPGTSEHQLGIAVDISGAVYAIYGWLAENSWQYGFIQRYPPDKTAITGIEGEEWHFRYVGVEAATEMHEKGLCLEEYLAQK